MSIYVVRHGQTLFNKLNKNQGWIDSDLTQEGIEKLQTNFEKVNLPYFEKVYCSDLGRARKTLSILFKYIKYNENEVYYTKKLRERFLGSFEGDYLPSNRNKIASKEGYTNIEQLLSENSFWELVNLTKKHDKTKLAEDYLAFSSRINSLLDSIMNSKGNENILIVAHANPIKYLIEYLTKEEKSITINNGSILRFDKVTDDWKVKKLI